ncbi:MAG: alkaline phosphatase [Bacteroidales bacterium]|nr:alkaline phosphatase [Bacteroidota bacterium]MBL6949595.1 alkaline phosphatase [Bacteroidales bacterium]
MKRKLSITAIIIVLSSSIFAQVKVKNVILMIPDGTSSEILSIARWYKYGTCAADNCRLAIDPHICGMVSTYNSDSPIGDSAPTGSTYATGYLSNTGFVATYPISSGERDLIKVNPDRAYHPLFTILEAAKLQGKSTGVVMTSQFTHATPAGFAAHTPDRDNKEAIAIQMVYNKLNVVFGGGLQYLDPDKRKDDLDLFSTLRSRNYHLVTTVEQFDALTPADTLVYGLFTDNYLPNDLDRDPEKVPSLAEMTRKAIKILSTNPNGFFLMVEGSKIDWSAHVNDPVGVITEFLAFDYAVKEAMEFANRDGYTAVVVVPDHGNSGISLGNSRSDRTYDVLPINDLIQPLRECKMTEEGISGLIRTNPSEAGEIFYSNTGIRLTDDEVQQVIDAMNSTNKYLMPVTVAGFINKDTYIGFTTHGHTGEDVFLAAYHPANYRPSGVTKNTELHEYLTEILDLPNLDSLSSTYFCVDSVALQGLNWEIVNPVETEARLIIRPAGKSNKRAEIIASSDYLTIFNIEKPIKQIPFSSLAIYVQPIEHFFIPRNLGTLIADEFAD